MNSHKLTEAANQKGLQGAESQPVSRFVRFLETSFFATIFQRLNHEEYQVSDDAAEARAAEPQPPKVKRAAAGAQQ